MIKRLKTNLQTIVTIAIAMVLVLAGSGLVQADSKKFVPGELLIQVKQGVTKGAVDKLLNSYDAATAGEIESIKTRRIKVPVHALEQVKKALSKNPNIQFVEENFYAEAGYVPNDDRYSSQWHLPMISAPGAWDLTTGSPSVPIAIIDSGVDPTHPDLAGNLIAGYNFLENNTDTQDVLGHGTAVAGSAAAMTDNITGVAGVAGDSPIMPLVVLDANDYATYYDIARAINYAADQGVRIINISIGGSSYSSTLQNAVNYAWNKGAVIFACAHNYSTDTPYYPAACANVVAVSATTSTDTFASFSNHGDWIDISAPGTYILTTSRGGGYGNWNGTSFSSPITAGVAALILSANPSLTNTQVVNILTQSADDLGSTGFDNYFGYGRVNALQSILAALAAVPEEDTIDPSVAITSPQNDTTVNGSLTVSVSATDEGGVDRVELHVNGELLSSDTTSPYTFSWDTYGYANSDHELMAVAYDTAGNAGWSSVITVTVANESDDDTQAPVVAITSIQGGALVSGGITVDVSATDEGGVALVELYLDGVLLDEHITSPYAFFWDTTAYANGTYALVAVAFDTAGNQGVSEAINVSVDNVIFEDTEAPVVTITSPGDGASIGNRETVQASASDAGGISRMELFLNEELTAVKYKSELSWNWNTRKLSKGTYTLSVKAFDTAGNEGIDTITVYK
ncbi:putative alkaline serine protease (subtilase family protein) [Desulforapulum autotrophicum HRM2]|uniref:Alkaline serine protease (Subtilase family protein) n=1 Tax=Desulforapulum autotrophicum (strain ATCC 43914 / DSM 3382 / VKM B-1955 / HRM2) TaxID=177437 RepID=C0QHZ8_DESAH|nr:Ig-like domain-containing protein [Desulforapulum autotrophicum]ACN15734.1 putative alkaline serine protease (subtilase family protein) [Desulforapulum autotrophicum HRM2]